jgi:DNA-binding response OmpR family regulator
MYLDKYSADTIVKVTSSPSPRRGKPVVLMVEDHHDAQLELKQVLTKKGYMVIDTDNGQDAMERAREARPDLLVVDMDIPLLFELVAARQIIKNARTGPIPALIVTHEEVVDLTPMSEIGAVRNEYVTRLSDFAELQPLLDYLLPVMNAGEEARETTGIEPTPLPLPLIVE